MAEDPSHLLSIIRPKLCRDMTHTKRKPSLHDRIARRVLRLAKWGRYKHRGNDLEFYEHFFTSQHVHESLYDLRHRLRRESINKVLADLSSSAVIVDVGCGVGNLIGAVASHCRKIGIEYAPHDLSLAVQQERPGVWFVRGSAHELPLSSEAVDVLLFIEVLEHLADERSVLREITRCLKPGGQLIISVPNTYYFPDYFELIGHYRHYTRQQLCDQLGEVSLHVKRYIDDYPLLQLVHYYPYIIFSAINLLCNRCSWHAESMYVRPILGRFYSLLSKALWLLRRERSQKTLAEDERTTFIIAQKSP
jgi:2-polyprenyl-3-methyl-5-hydroxy-6-metoxy-1,4-benzoquinol methylase